MAARNIDHQEFEKLLQAGKPLLVDYWAPWCGYCRRIGPAYDKVAESQAGQLDVVKVNIDEAPVLAHQEHIEVIPTLVFYNGGKAVNSVVAPESKAAIDAFIEDSLRK